MTSGRYAKYLQSAHWQEMRAKVFARAGGVCERDRCQRFAAQVHHKTYARIGAERMGDLEALCVPCHQKRHPDKIKLMARPVAAQDFQCLLCPSDRAEVYIGDWELRFICSGCGEPRVVLRKDAKAWKPKGKHRKPRKKGDKWASREGQARAALAKTRRYLDGSTRK